MDKLSFTLNGERIEETQISPTTTLLNYVRARKLKGSKEGCAEGDCGACTVVIIDHRDPRGPTFKAVNSCLVLLPMVQGKEVFTVESLRRFGGTEDGGYHPVQSSLVSHLGSQCGYCTPGVIMSMFEACYRADLDEDWKLDDQMCGNLCRCTGYRPIMDAARQIAGLQPEDGFAEALSKSEPGSMALEYTTERQRFFTPTSFDTLFDVLEANPDARFVVGGTDLSLEITKRFAEIPCLVSLEGLDDLHLCKQDGEGPGSRWHVGAAVALSTLEDATRVDIPSIERMLRFFGARQIKNRGTVGGNLCNASPIGDMAPILIALGAEVTLRSRAGTRSLPLEDFFLAYRKTALEHGEILDSVQLTTPPEGARHIAYKVSKRQELDISAVSAGLYIELDDAGVVTTARFAYGGMAATPKRAAGAEAAVLGQTWSEATAEAAAAAIADDFTPMTDHRGSAWYRGIVAANLLRGFYLETTHQPSPRLPYRPTATVIPEVTP